MICGILFGEQKQLGEEVQKAEGKWTDEQNEKWDRMEKDFSDSIQTAQRLEGLEKVTAAQGEKAEELADKIKIDGGTDALKDKEQHKSRVFEQFIAFGESSLNADELKVLNGMRNGFDRENMRALSVGTNAAGGFLVPEGFANRITDAKVAFGGMREAATIIETESGNDLPWPKSNDGAGPTNPNKGVILAENTQVAEKDIIYSSVTLQAFKYSSKLIRVSIELLQDSFRAPSQA